MPDRVRRRPHHLAVVPAVLLLAVLACDHTEPFGYPAPAAPGPFSAAFPRRLTFNEGDDRSPTISGSTVAYSRLTPTRPAHDRCLAFLPDTGGTLLREVCPDTTSGRTEAWLYPALSPGGSRIAYWRQTGLIGGLGATDADLVVAPASAPESATVVARSFRLPDGSIHGYLRQLTWGDSATLRFIVGDEAIGQPVPDTVFTGVALAQLDLVSGQLTVLSIPDSAPPFARAPDGGIWFGRGMAVMHVAPPDTVADTVVTFPYVVKALANAGGIPVATVEIPPSCFDPDCGGPMLEVLALPIGVTTPTIVWGGADPLELAGAPDQPLVVLALRRRDPPGANLWLVSLK